MDLLQRVIDLERRLNNLQRYGVVIELDENTARVKVKTEEITTGWLPWLAQRAGQDRMWWCPEEQEQVIIHSPSGDLNQGYVQSAFFQQAFPANGNDKNIHRIDYANGGYYEHNRQTGRLKLYAKGDIELKAEGTLWLDASRLKVFEK